MQPAITVEWNCTRCGGTNRKLVSVGTTEVTDHCINCGPKTVHTITPSDRPVRWNAKMTA